MKTSLLPASLSAFLLSVFLIAPSSQALGQQGPPCILLGMLGVPCPTDEPDMVPPNTADVSVVSHAPVIWLVPPEGTEPFAPIAGASSTVHRNSYGITGSMTTSGMLPESAYTFWWVVFNNPEYCASIPCTEDDLFNPDVAGGVFGGSGQVTDAYGRAHFQGHVFAGDEPGLDRPFADVGLVAGLIDPFKAEIHLLTRNHGLASALLPEELEAALSTYVGGCDKFGCFDEQAAVHFP